MVEYGRSDGFPEKGAAERDSGSAEKSTVASDCQSMSAILANMPAAIEAEAWAYCNGFRDVKRCRGCGRRDCTPEDI